MPFALFGGTVEVERCSAPAKGNQVIISEDARERMRRAYYLEKKSLRQITCEEGYCRETIKKAITDASPRSYNLSHPRPAIVLERPVYSQFYFFSP